MKIEKKDAQKIEMIRQAILVGTAILIIFIVVISFYIQLPFLG